MRQEILAAKGQLAVYRRDLIDLEVQARGLVQLVRGALSPYEKDVTFLRADEAASAAARLAEVICKMKELKSEIAKLEADLGREA